MVKKFSAPQRGAIITPDYGESLLKLAKFNLFSSYRQSKFKVTYPPSTVPVSSAFVLGLWILDRGYLSFTSIF